MWADDPLWYPLFLRGDAFRVRALLLRFCSAAPLAPLQHPARLHERAAALLTHAARDSQGTFWFRETTRLVAHELSAADDADMAADAADE